MIGMFPSDMGLRIVPPGKKGYIEGVHPSQKDIDDYEEELANMPKKTLKKRPCHIRSPELEKLKGIMEKLSISILVVPLADDSPLSGEGDLKGYLLWVYFDPKAEQKVLRAVQSACGFDLGAKEGEPVDPDSEYEEEQYIMYHPGNVIYMSAMEYELLRPGQKQPDRKDGCYIGPGYAHQLLGPDDP